MSWAMSLGAPAFLQNRNIGALEAYNKGAVNRGVGTAWGLVKAGNPFFDTSKAKDDIQKMNFDIINRALADTRRNTTGNLASWESAGRLLASSGDEYGIRYKDKSIVNPDQERLLDMLSRKQQGTTAWNDLLGKMRNQYMDRYEGEQKGTQAQLERMRKLGLASQVPTANTPAAQREGALTAALQNGGGTDPMMHKGREVMSPFADRMRNYTQQQQQTQQPTQQQPQTQGAVYGGFGQSPLTQALQSGGQAQVTSNRYRPVTNWGSGGFRSVLSGF